MHLPGAGRVIATADGHRSGGIRTDTYGILDRNSFAVGGGPRGGGAGDLRGTSLRRIDL
ncbi:hypothetical protein LJR045_000163 [Microbacterium sp. LjRoot45]|uniref:hypothetical protein n=1 Tax=Microbacterium sp. LjRoot45 TaxID=3342329 RepID=UPI003ECE8CBF